MEKGLEAGGRRIDGRAETSGWVDTAPAQMSASVTSLGWEKILPRMQRFASLLAVLSLLVQVAGVEKLPAQDQTGIDLRTLEVTEDLSESMANDLLELSVAIRDRDTALIAQFVAESVRGTPFPSEPAPSQAVVKWVHRHGWKTPKDEPQELSRAEFLERMEKFLSHFARIEDARFKVKHARFAERAEVVAGAKVPTAAAGATGEARVAFFIVGQDTEGRREWLRGTMVTKLRRAGNDRWQIQQITLQDLRSMVAETSLFSEVAIPGGVAATRPAYGTPGNMSFVWHGALAADLDGDGWIDIFAAGPERNYLYRNDGQGRFEDISEAAGLLYVDGGVAPVALDYDNDGDQDIFLSAVGAQMLLENRQVPDGKLEFRDVSVAAGLAHESIGFSAAVGDVNGDGWPDIYVTAYNLYGRVMPDSWFRATNGRPNLLFVNQGNGQFREEAGEWGIDDRRWSYSATFADVNEDGRLDLYVVNDFGENGLFINQGERFVDEAGRRGAVDPGNGMGVSFGDYNNDGRLDLHVTNMSSTAGNRILARLFPASSPRDNVLMKLASGNTLLENEGAGRYRDVTAEAGGFSGGWAWGGGFLDFDNDGWEDLFTPNGFISGKSMRDT